MKNEATILLFHRVNPVRDVLWDPMSPALFKQIIAYVSKKFDVLPLQEICLGNPITKKPRMAITFDDGFHDFIDYALPVLKKYECHSSMYVVTNCVEQNLPTWTYILDYLFFHTRKLHLSDVDFGDELADIAEAKWQNDTERVAFCKRLKPRLKRLNSESRESILKACTRSFDDVSLPRNLMMSWQDLASLDKKYVTIGSHTISHPPLATIAHLPELEKEIKTSAEIIQQKSGTYPESISYPVGSYDSRTKKVAAASGYKFGLAVDQKIYRPGRQDLFAIPRIELYNDSFLRSKLKINGIESAIKSIFKR